LHCQSFEHSKALRYLADENFAHVVVADEGINVNQNLAVLSFLMGWVNLDGTAVIDCLFPSSISGIKFDQFFEKKGGVLKDGQS